MRIRGNLKKVLRALFWAFTLLFVTSMLAAGLFRLYFSDERLRTMAAELGTQKTGVQVSIGELDLSLFSGIELKNLKISPPPDFKYPVLEIRRLVFDYSFSDLFSLEMHIRDMAIEGFAFHLEGTPGATNLDWIKDRLTAGTKKTQKDPKIEDVDKSKSFNLPKIELPLPVIIDRMAFVDTRFSITQPDMSATLTGMQAEGKFRGEGETLILDLWAGLGTSDMQHPAILLFRQKDKDEIQSSQTLGVQIHTQNISESEIQVKIDIQTQIKPSLPTFIAKGGGKIEIELAEGHVQIPDFSFIIGEHTKTYFSVDLKDIFTTPIITLNSFTFDSDLSEYNQWMQPFMPGSQITGLLHAESPQLSLTQDDLKTPEKLPFALTSSITNMNISTPKFSANDMDATFNLKNEDDLIDIDGVFTMGSSMAGLSTAQGLKLDYQVQTKLTPWLPLPDAPDASDSPEITTTMSMTLDQAAFGEAMSARNIRYSQEARLPIAMITQKTPGQINVDMLIKVGETRAANTLVRNIKTIMHTQMDDLLGDSLQNQMSVTSGDIELTLPKGKIMLPGFNFEMKTRRNGQRVKIKPMDFKLGEIMHSSGELDIDQALTQHPVARHFEMRLDNLNLAQIIATLPKSMAIPGKISGHMQAQLSLFGPMPIADFLALSKASTPPPPNPNQSVSERLKVLTNLLEASTTRLAKIPTRWDASMSFHSLNIENEGGDIQNGSMNFFTKHEAPKTTFGYSMQLPQILSKASVNNFETSGALDIDTHLFNISFDATTPSVKHSLLATPVSDFGMHFRANYQLGEDARMDDFSLSTTLPNIKIKAHGGILRPLQFLLSQGWKTPDLIGLDLALKGSMRALFAREHPLLLTGPDIDGGIEITGSMDLRGGMAKLLAEFNAEHFDAAIKEMSVKDMHGSFPMDFALAFKKRDDAVTIVEDIPIGGGVLSLLVAADDVRQRPARPTYFERLRPYRNKKGLSIAQTLYGPYEVSNMSFDGRLVDGMILGDHITLNVLGGDIVGDFAFQLGLDNAFRMDMGFKVSNLDASYFKMLNLEAGPDSELSADMRYQLLLGKDARDVGMDMNITKIGAKTLDRLLLVLDPEEKDEKLQKQRKNLWVFEYGVVKLNKVAVWLRYENLYMNLLYDTFVKVPFTEVAWRPIDRELVTRYSLSEMLDVFLNPIVDKTLAKWLGWK